MRRTKTETIGEALMLFLRQEGLETPLNERKLIAAWPKVVGGSISRYSTAMYIRQQRLYVRVSSSPLRANLIQRRKELMASLNQAVGTQLIYDIVFL